MKRDLPVPREEQRLPHVVCCEGRLEPSCAHAAPQVATRYFKEEPAGTGRLVFKEAYSSESAILELVQAPSDNVSPQVEEQFETIRDGLMQLRRNVILLQDDTDPVSPPPPPPPQPRS